MYHKDTPNIVSSLKQQGYRTDIIGKFHVNPAEAFPFDFKEIPTANFARKDLEMNPYEICNLTGESGHAEKLAEFQEQLAAWRIRTRDPLLNSDTLQLLKAEVESIASKKAAKKYAWGYPDYFFGKEPPIRSETFPMDQKSVEGRRLQP